MFRLLIFALLISSPALAQQAQPASPTIVMPGQTIVREIPPAQVNVPPLPQPLIVSEARKPWAERNQQWIIACISILTTVAGFLVVTWQTGKQIKAAREQTTAQIEADRALLSQQLDAAETAQRRANEEAKCALAAVLVIELDYAIEILRKINGALLKIQLQEADSGRRIDETPYHQVFYEHDWTIFKMNAGNLGILRAGLASDIVKAYHFIEIYDKRIVDQERVRDGLFSRMASDINRTIPFIVKTKDRLTQIVEHGPLITNPNHTAPPNQASASRSASRGSPEDVG
ncbi:MAG: hypothetical protein ACRC67_16820 [Inquilinus sp.]|uniref:hypothetical protein n=1 Tax=Inquilinus sp. TaxID=1932117 RepID=UPI003F36F7F9